MHGGLRYPPLRGVQESFVVRESHVNDSLPSSVTSWDEGWGSASVQHYQAVSENEIFPEIAPLVVFRAPPHGTVGIGIRVQVDRTQTPCSGDLYQFMKFL